MNSISQSQVFLQTQNPQPTKNKQRWFTNEVQLLQQYLNNPSNYTTQKEFTKIAHQNFPIRSEGAIRAKLSELRKSTQAITKNAQTIPLNTKKLIAVTNIPHESSTTSSPSQEIKIQLLLVVKKKLEKMNLPIKWVAKDRRTPLPQLSQYISSKSNH